MADRGGYNYGNNVISGSAQVLQGDSHIHYHHHHNEILPQPHKYDILYHSLSFEQMDARLRNVETAIPQTCRWLLSHEQFVLWTDHHRVREHHGLLWLKGKPGSGKSTIMKMTLDWAKGKWKDQITLSYFFNARASGELEKSCLGLYRSIVCQLLLACESVRPHFVNVFWSKERDGRVESWAETELQNFLLQLINTRRLPYLNIFVDALDEGDEDGIQRMVAFFEKTADYSMLVGSVFRLCLSSRHYPRISIEIGLSLVVENQPGHTRDIEAYIDKTLPGKNTVLMNDIKDTLLQKAGNVFLWVVLSVSLLKPLYSRGRVKKMKSKLADIPPGLYNLFSTIITKHTDALDECITLLQWMLVSKRVLSANELYLAIHSRNTASDIAGAEELDQPMVVNFILDCSRGLIELTTDRQPRVQFIHETVRQFLISIDKHGAHMQNAGPVVVDFRSDICHDVVAEGCLKYLMHVCEMAPVDAKTLKGLPLASYSATYWWQHMQATMGISSPQALDPAVQLLTGSRANLLTWLQLYNIDETLWEHQNFSLMERDLAPSIYYAGCIGVTELMKRLIHLGIDVNAQGGRYGNALQAASLKGHKEVVQLLLEKGADINAQGGHYGNALQAASWVGPTEVVQLLLDKGADINAQEGRYGSALQVASWEGHKEVVQLLLDKGADVNAQGGEYGNALQAASWEGRKEVVHLLLDKGADVNAQGGEYRNALQAASYRGYKEVVQLLLHKDADVNAQGGVLGNALQAASWDGHKDVVQLLLDKGADVNAQGAVFGTGLQAASLTGHKGVVQVLLDKGADVNTQGGYHGHALQAASYGGHKDVVQLLLEKGADVNAQGGVFGNALQAASGEGHKGVVQLLLDKGADVNVQGGHYGNALQAASWEGHKGWVQLLLDKGADVNAQGAVFGNALQAASLMGHKDVVQVLLDKGADVNTQGGYHGHALQAASYRGYKDVVQLLLEKGADVNAQGGRFGNALKVASLAGHKEVVQMLHDLILKS